jgi:uncharacterized membrane protein YkoI
MMRCLLCFLLVLCGCGSPPAASNTDVPLSEVAPELLRIAEKTLPGVKFESARKKKVKGEDVLEIRGKLPNGKIREVEVNAAGKVIEIE